MKIGNMAAPLDDQFIREINQNLGIAHKVCNVYFSASEEKEDVLQEMMYQLWRSYPSFQQHAKFSTWMYRVCLNTALTYLRKNKRKRNEILASEHHRIPDPGRSGTDENIQTLYEAISRLSPINKAIILLYLEDMSYDEIADVTSLSKSRIQKQKNTSMKYFWSAFTLQIIVYALLSHVAIKYGADTPVLLVSIFLAFLYVPFTVMLLRKFKRMAVLKANDKNTAGMPIHEYVTRQHGLLSSFYRFKRKYEMILIPLSSAIMIWIFFRIYLPGGIIAHPIGATICFLLTLWSCIAAIAAENKKRFKQPLSQLEEILQDLKQ